MFESMAEAAAVFELVYDGSGAAVDCIFRDMNPAFEFLVGCEEGRTPGQPCVRVFGEVLRLDLFHRVSVTGQPGAFETYAPSFGKYVVISVLPTNPRTRRGHFHRHQRAQGDGRNAPEDPASPERDTGSRKDRMFDWNVVTGQVQSGHRNLQGSLASRCPGTGTL